ncbi:hypothetical protein CHS0354_020373 [Potamilus streckersoni]|uniref:Uncharacterized protein n=1 Tax=Potamilus streckersoni TaxID=2493646 RepID=A0AAE0VWY1_9BIVA|nr:hypothetical protein CHS0354_020373 [Potamilus streckersoni]
MPKPKKKEFSSLKVKQKKRPSLMKQLSQPFYSSKKKNKFVNGVHPLPNSSANMQKEKELILVVDDNLFVPLRREIEEEKILALTEEDTVEPLIGPHSLKLKLEPLEMYSSVDSGYASPPGQGDFHVIPKGILKKMSPTSLSNQVTDASSISPSVTFSEKIVDYYKEVSSLPFNANSWSDNISFGTKNGSLGLQTERPMSPSGQPMSPIARALSQNARPLSPYETPSSPNKRPMSPNGMAAIDDALDLLDDVIEENGQTCLSTGSTLTAKRKVVKKCVSFGNVTEIQKICCDCDNTFEDLAVVKESASFDSIDELKEENEYSTESKENQEDLSHKYRKVASLDNVISHESLGDTSGLKDKGHLTCEVELKLIEITPLSFDHTSMEHDQQQSVSTVLQSFQIMHVLM